MKEIWKMRSTNRFNNLPSEVSSEQPVNLLQSIQLIFMSETLQGVYLPLLGNSLNFSKVPFPYTVLESINPTPLGKGNWVWCGGRKHLKFIKINQKWFILLRQQKETDLYLVEVLVT